MPEHRRQRGLLTLEVALSRMDRADWLPFLAYLEQEAKRDADLQILHAIRDWRAANLAVPVRKDPPESA